MVVLLVALSPVEARPPEPQVHLAVAAELDVKLAAGQAASLQ
jgi:hypothetical protein